MDERRTVILWTGVLLIGYLIGVGGFWLLR